MAVRCPQCGQEVRAGRMRCPHCLAPLRAGSPAVAPTPRRGWSWRLVAAGLIAALGLGILALPYWSRLAAGEAPTAIATTTMQAPSLTPAPRPSATSAPLPSARPAPTVAPQPAATPRPTSVTRATATAIARETSAAPDANATAAALATTATAFASGAPAAQAAQPQASARYAPDLEARLLANGYHANIVSIRGMRGLRASQGSYSASVWIRDLDYATAGYGYALGDMSLLRESLELFLRHTRPDGVVPEVIVLNWDDPVVYQQSWDSMPNLIRAVYAYVAKTGDREFYLTHREPILRAGEWIARLDSDGDGLPDREIFPYGYYDSVKNGPMHTYALAMFYAAFNNLAELERYAGHDGAGWEERAARLREGFHSPESGYWLPEQPWPVAWLRPGAPPVNILETFGVFEALRSGLIAPADGERYRALIALLHERLPELIAGPTPMRLTLGGYDQELRREVDPPVPLWMLDASAPWVVGLAAPVYAAAGYPQDARAVVGAYMAMARSTEPPVLEFAAGPQARYGPGDSGDRGRTWDSAAWFLAVYGGHYGIQMTPAAVIVQPRPFETIPGDRVENLSYQGVSIQLALDVERRAYRIRADRPIAAILRPLGTARQLRVDGGAPRREVSLLLEPEHEYVIVSEG